MSTPVTITEAAALQIKDMMKEHEEENAFLRVGVKGGGCSGLSYGMGFDHEVSEKIRSSNSTASRFLSTPKALTS